MEKAMKADDQRCEIAFIKHIRDTSGSVKGDRRRMQKESYMSCRAWMQNY